MVKNVKDKPAKPKHAGGRPTKYTEEFIKKEAIALIEYVKSEKIPFIKDFCFRRGYSSQRVYDTFVKVKEFSDSLLLYKDKFESIIVQGAMSNKFNSYFAFNTLKNCSGWRDKVDVDHGINKETEETLAKYGTVGIQAFRERFSSALGQSN